MKKNNQIDRKNQILEAAFKVFIDKGYSKTTMDDIVERSGLSKGALYHYYKSKKDKIEFLDKVGWKRFLQFEFNDNSSKVRRFIIDCITKDVKLDKFSFNRKVLFPLKSDKK